METLTKLTRLIETTWAGSRVEVQAHQGKCAASIIGPDGSRLVVRTEPTAEQAVAALLRFLEAARAAARAAARSMAQIARKAVMAPRPEAALDFPAPSTTKLATSDAASSDGASGNAALNSGGGAGAIPRSDLNPEHSHPTPNSSSAQPDGASQLTRAEADGGTGTPFDL